MALSDPIPVRFSASADAGLASVSGKTGMSKAELIRIAVTEFLRRVAETGEIVQRISVDTHGDQALAQFPRGDAINSQSLRLNEVPTKAAEPRAAAPKGKIIYRKHKAG